MKWHLVFDDLAIAHSKITETQPFTIQVEGKNICLGKHQGEFYAVEDSCPHQGVSLSKGTISSDGLLRCPKHWYLFNLTSGDCHVGSCRNLDTFPIKIDQEKLYISIY